jgi:hypothetical protein
MSGEREEKEEEKKRMCKVSYLDRFDSLSTNSMTCFF